LEWGVIVVTVEERFGLVVKWWELVADGYARGHSWGCLLAARRVSVLAGRRRERGKGR
jgi:hypothetical protein